jgi:hypothetical protein
MTREDVPRRRWGLEQIQLLLGHASVQTTERYLGTKQDLVHAPNDGIKREGGGVGRSSTDHRQGEKSLHGR